MNDVVRIAHVLIIEDHDLMRVALIEEVKKAISNVLIQGAKTFEIASDLLCMQSFDIVLTDPGLPGVNPVSVDERIAIITKIIHAAPQAKHLIFTGFYSIKEEHICKKLGVLFYLSKIALDREGIALVLKQVMKTSSVNIRNTTSNHAPEYCYSKLAPREQYVIQRMLERPENTLKKHVIEEIALCLHIDEDTVMKYYKTARAKLKNAHILPNGL